MASIDFFGDFCLTCDQQTNGTTFCSQACRLVELERYVSSSEPSSPTYMPGSSSQSQRSSAAVGSGFQLPPAYDFSLHRNSSTTSLSTSTSSASSTSSKPAAESKLTEQARNDLRNYVGSFDQTRTIRRRVSLQSN